ncbi:hypothetical protein [Shimia sagamensis]|uniref:Excalibur calcium-binding domain-containing protein n=1 Tax=Shimia sagamensis TaxID=1566352 RepID=A0ABY1NX30_9RHOB|nr:hypothetical protein [Shimia sagamensis]SMP19496.1 hypothetical protein SAMN06265373_103425 [Shimia sagamensis]
MKRSIGAICALVTLSACQPPVPDSAAGVFYDEVTGEHRNTALPPAKAVSQETIPDAPQVATIQPVVPVQTTTATPLTTTTTAKPRPTAAVNAVPPTGSVPAINSDAASIASETTAALAAASANSGELPLDASPSNPAPQVFSNPGISDENDFAAVDGRRTIEADAARRQQNKANYTVIQPTAVPVRTGDAGPNIVAYALDTKHPRGTKMHSRLKIGGASRYDKACAKFSSDEAAQRAFLEKGGPKKDRLGVDPDGDGYACKWDPSPFRVAAGN